MEAHECYRAAISLNNTGVSLIERGNYHAARDVLGDAISISRHLFHLDDSVVGNLGPKQLAIEACLRRASQRMAFFNPLRLNEPKASCPHALRLYALTDDKGPATLEAALYTGITVRHAFVLRIELVDYDSPLDRDISTDVSVIIQNLAVSYRFMAENQGTKDGAYAHLVMALRMCNLAYSTLADHAYRVKEDESVLMSILPLSILTVQNTIQISLELGLENEASDNLWKFVQLRDVAQYFEEVELGRAFHVAAAA